MYSSQKLGILDFGSQYTHLLASQIRKLGAFSEIILPQSFSSKKAQQYQALVLSGGPSSIYETQAPRCSSDIFHLNIPILAICYGYQLLVDELKGEVQASEYHEYGAAVLEIQRKSPLLPFKIGDNIRVWMSHGDRIYKVPPHFETIARTRDCPHAVIAHKEKKILALQFHPEVQHTEKGREILSHFLNLSHLRNTWSLSHFLKREEEKNRKNIPKDKKVFFLLSGGVDSSVAFALLSRSLGSERLLGLYIDTGLMRLGESEEIKRNLSHLGNARIEILDASSDFFSALQNIYDPEEKRKIIGELFIQIQQAFTKKLGLDPEKWYIGQGTIYPDQIESGTSQNSHTIKTHHNRVEAISLLLEKGLIIEPLSSLYKDEVRELGALLNLHQSLLERHPFPGPGLAIRCLCSSLANEKKYSILENIENKEIIDQKLAKLHISLKAIPALSVGVQGDKRSYSPCLSLFYQKDLPDFDLLFPISKELINRHFQFNRVLLHIGPCTDIKLKRKKNAFITPKRIGYLRKMDHIVSCFLHEKNIYKDIWQFPVVFLPLSITEESDSESLVLRPVCSVDAMTASPYFMKKEYLWELYERLIALPFCDAVFYDLSTKPPGTIEWE